jgi:hypothetical protein
MSKGKTSLPRYPRTLNRTEFRILETAAQVRYAGVEDYKVMHFSRGCRTWCQKVLSGLCDGDWQTGGYLVKLPIPTARGNSARVYVLSYRGALLLRQNAIRADFFYRANRMRNRSFNYLAHQMACTKMYISSVLLCRRSAYQLYEALTADALRSDPPTTTIEREGRKTKTTVIPDVYVCLEQETDGEYQYTSIWFEVDTGSERRSLWEGLLHARIAFLKQGYAEYFQTSDCVVAYVVIGPPAYRAARLRQLRSWTAALLSKEGLLQWIPVFKFAAVDMDSVYSYPRTILAEPVWYTAGDCQPSPLVDITPTAQQEASLTQKEKRNGLSIQG